MSVTSPPYCYHQKKQEAFLLARTRKECHSNAERRWRRCGEALATLQSPRTMRTASGAVAAHRGASPRPTTILGLNGRPKGRRASSTRRRDRPRARRLDGRPRGRRASPPRRRRPPQARRLDGRPRGRWASPPRRRARSRAPWLDGRPKVTDHPPRL